MYVSVKGCLSLFASLWPCEELTTWCHPAFTLRQLGSTPQCSGKGWYQNKGSHTHIRLFTVQVGTKAVEELTTKNLFCSFIVI